MNRTTDAPTTPRQRARAALVAEIKAVALRQVAERGAGRLSLRAITREIGMVSSGIYRYFASRDELLTALIVDAYTDLAGTLEAARRPATSPRTQWHDTCAALRTFARDQPHRFALVYGTPVSDYRAPTDTIEPAARVVRALAAPTASTGAVTDGPEPSGELVGQLAVMAQALDSELPPAGIATVVGAIAQLLGLLTLELGGHFVGTFEPADELYADAVTRLADRIGLA